jgi:hypothetical protein
LNNYPREIRFLASWENLIYSSINLTTILIVMKLLMFSPGPSIPNSDKIATNFSVIAVLINV